MTSPWPNPALLPNPPRRPALNTDQMRLLHMLANGLTHYQMARRVGCHANTVRQRLHRAYLVLGANNGPHAVAIIARAGLLPAPNGKTSR